MLLSRLCAQAVNTYQQLAALLRGEQPKGLLLPAPRGYVASRVRTLAEGAVMREFEWAGGGQWAGKAWSAELPTDTAMLLFLFAAFLAVRLCLSGQSSHCRLNTVSNLGFYDRPYQLRGSLKLTGRPRAGAKVGVSNFGHPLAAVGCLRRRALLRHIA